MARAKQSCIYCDGKGKVVRFEKKYPCPYCFPPPGAIASKINDKMTEITHYGKDGKVLRVDKTVHKARKENPDEVVNDQVRLQPEEEKQEPQSKAKRRSHKSRTRKRSG